MTQSQGLGASEDESGGSPPSGASRIQLGLAVHMLDDGLTQLGLGKALLEAGQRVTDDVAGRKG